MAAIAAGSLHNLVLVRAGAASAAGSAKSAKAGSGANAVWSWGCNDDQALGRVSDEWLPAPVDGPLGQGSSGELPGGTVQIACGASHSIALSATGDVYSWGTYRDANGVIGFSDTIDAASRPHQLTTLPKGVKVVQIGAGEHHDILLTEHGEGQSRTRTRAHGHMRFAIRLMFLSLLCLCACVCVCSVYQWGDIGIGRRFSDRHKKNKLTPSRVVFKRAGGVAPPKRIEQVFAGGHSNFALDSEGTAWFWGPNNYNQASTHEQRTKTNTRVGSLALHSGDQTDAAECFRRASLVKVSSLRAHFFSCCLRLLVCVCVFVFRPVARILTRTT